MKQREVFLGLGSNVGDRKLNLLQAIKLLGDSEYISILQHSSIIETEPVGVVDQGKFLNMVIEVETSLTPLMLLEFCLETERLLGRVRDAKWTPRTLDIDILFYGDQIIDSKELTVPHPEAHRRGFVLLPLVEIAPRMHHPSLNISAKEMLHVL